MERRKTGDMREAPSTAERLLTRRQVAELFGVHPRTVTRWARSGRLRAVHTAGGHRRYSESEVRRVLGRDVGARPSAPARVGTAPTDQPALPVDLGRASVVTVLPLRRLRPGLCWPCMACGELQAVGASWSAVLRHGSGGVYLVVVCADCARVLLPGTGAPGAEGGPDPAGAA